MSDGDPTAQLGPSPYDKSLGVRVEAVEAERIRLRVPYKDDNSNPGRALHGGVVASAIDIAGALAARGGYERGAAVETGTLDLAVSYLAAAIGEDIVATAEVLRRGKEIAYSEIDVRTDAGKRIAIGLVTHRVIDLAAHPAWAERQRATIAEPMGGEESVIQNARAFMTVPFISRLGIEVAEACDGRARLRMDFRPENADSDGAVHEGALAALIDTTGSLASWSITGLNFAYKASTVGMHANYHARAVGEDVLADARTMRRNNEIFLNEVTVMSRASGRVVATGSVVYRIVVPD